MELTLHVPAGRQLIERYSANGFRISGVIWREPVLVFGDKTLPWTAAPSRQSLSVTAESLMPVVEHGGVQILLLGLGKTMPPLGREARALLRGHGIAIEPMDTGAACRTYNLLVGENRRVAAALLPPV